MVRTISSKTKKYVVGLIKNLKLRTFLQSSGKYQGSIPSAVGRWNVRIGFQSCFVPSKSGMLSATF